VEISDAGGASPGLIHSMLPLSSEYGTYKTVKARFWPGLSGSRCEFFPLRSEAVLSILTALGNVAAALLCLSVSFLTPTLMPPSEY